MAVFFMWCIVRFLIEPYQRHAFWGGDGWLCGWYCVKPGIVSGDNGVFCRSNRQAVIPKCARSNIRCICCVNVWYIPKANLGLGDLMRVCVITCMSCYFIINILLTCNFCISRWDIYQTRNNDI